MKAMEEGKHFLVEGKIRIWKLPSGSNVDKMKDAVKGCRMQNNKNQFFCYNHSNKKKFENLKNSGT